MVIEGGANGSAGETGHRVMGRRWATRLGRRRKEGDRARLCSAGGDEQGDGGGADLICGELEGVVDLTKHDSSSS